MKVFEERVYKADREIASLFENEGINFYEVFGNDVFVLDGTKYIQGEKLNEYLEKKFDEQFNSALMPKDLIRHVKEIELGLIKRNHNHNQFHKNLVEELERRLKRNENSIDYLAFKIQEFKEKFLQHSILIKILFISNAITFIIAITALFK